MVSINDKGRRRLPPYISYRTFRNFLDDLQQGVPARIDRSYWGERMSGSTGTQLVAALRFLGLIDGDASPTDRLKKLAILKGNARAEQLRLMTTEAFGFLSGSVDTQTATYAQLEEAFHHTFQLTGDVSRKCIKFYVAIASDVGFPLSSFITKKVRSPRSGVATKAVTRRKNTRTEQNFKVPQDGEIVPDSVSWDKLLLDKFPALDPTWNDELKLAWFKDFDKLLDKLLGMRLSRGIV